MVKLGIPHSEFLSWDEDDQDKAIAWVQEEDELCPHCGTREDDWLDSEGRMLEYPPFEPVDRRCYGCKTSADYQAHLEELSPDSNGLFIALVPAQYDKNAVNHV